MVNSSKTTITIPLKKISAQAIIPDIYQSIFGAITKPKLSHETIIYPGPGPLADDNRSSQVR